MGSAINVVRANDQIYSTIQKGEKVYAVDSGAANAYVISLTPTVTVYTDGMEVRFRASNANTGASTLNIDGVGATAIKSIKNTDISAGDIPLNSIVTVIYNSTNLCFQLLSTSEIIPTEFGGTGQDLSSSTGVIVADSGTVSASAQLPNTKGGTGIDSSSSTGFVKISSGTWSVGSDTIQVSHTWAIPGEIKVASGDDDYINGMFINAPTGYTIKIASCRYRINSGTSATVSIKKNTSTDLTGFTGISVTTTAATTDPSDVTLSNNDYIAPVITAVSGTPTNMSFTIFITYERAS